MDTADVELCEDGDFVLEGFVAEDRYCVEVTSYGEATGRIRLTQASAAKLRDALGAWLEEGGSMERHIREAEADIAANAAKMREDARAIREDIDLMGARCIACNSGIYVTETVIEITTDGRQRLLHEDCWRRLHDAGLIGFSPDWNGFKPRRGVFSASGDYPPCITLR